MKWINQFLWRLIHSIKYDIKQYMEYQNAIDYCCNELQINDNSPYSIKRTRINTFLTQNLNKLPDRFHEMVDVILQYELSNKRIVSNISYFKPPISLWEGDITILNVDVIVNATNSQGLGCFLPNHKCIDNIIHAKAGPRLREECIAVLNKRHIETGELIPTLAYNLPSRRIYHTVGPIYDPSKKGLCREQLKACYTNCLNTLRNMQQHQIAFPCISTGEYGYPNDEGCVVAILAVKEWLQNNREYRVHIIFNTFKRKDTELYQKGLTKLL